jgi:hypothetical protein
MRIREGDIRRIVSEVIREGFSIKNFPREPIGKGEPTSLSSDEDEFYILGDDVKVAADVKRRFRAHPGFSSWLKLHTEKPGDIIGEVTRWNPRLEKSIHLVRDGSAMKAYADSLYAGAMSSHAIFGGEIPRRRVLVSILLHGGKITGMYNDDPMTEYHKTPSGWRYYPGNAEAVGDDHNEYLSLWQSRAHEAIENDSTWTISPDEIEGDMLYEATIVGGIPVAIMIDLENFKESIPRMTDGYRGMWEKFAKDVELIDLPLLDLQLRPILPSSLVGMISAVA